MGLACPGSIILSMNSSGAQDFVDSPIALLILDGTEVSTNKFLIFRIGLSMGL
jgi:hypothetical protein